MSNRVDAVRISMNRYIEENEVTIVSNIRPTIDNGYGMLIPDLTKTAVPTTLGTARVSRRSLPDPYVSGSRTPFDFKDVFYLLTQYDVTWLKKGIVFSYNGEKFKTRLPEIRKMFGEAVYKICGLEQVTSIDIGDFSG